MMDREVLREIVQKMTGGDFELEKHGKENEDLIYKTGEKAFLVVRPKTIEVRCDGKLAKLLQEKYETVMESRYFGRGGIEIVPTGQLEDCEVEDLVRLSWEMTKEG